MNRVRNLAKSKDPNHPWIEMDDMGIFRSAVLYERDFETGQEGFNLAAVLLFGKNETIQSCLPAYRTDAIYREANMDRYDDRDDVRTNLIDSYDRLTDFICRHIDDKFCLEGTQRVSVRSIIAREIVSNILMHREYMSPYPARIIIEKDKIMTENANKTCHYGRVLTTSTPFPKNPTIAKFFNNIGRADELGSGVRNLYKYTKMYSDSEPLLFEDDVFKVEIPLGFINGGDKAAISGDKTKSERISTQEHDILQYIIKNGAISNAQACELLNLKSSRVREIFNSMLDKDLIDHVGEKKNRKYVINTKE